MTSESNQHILIGDVGGTSSRWELAGSGLPQLRANGFNPYVSDDNALKKILNENVRPWLTHELHAINYYGAGCASDEFQKRVEAAIAGEFPDCEVNVSSDLIAAGRALFGGEQGLAIILGTGMNAGLFNNGELQAGIPSVGYLLGDEGAGIDLGRQFITAYLRGKVPADLSNIFKSEVEMDNGQLLRSVYSHEMPNMYLASFTKFIRVHCEHDYLARLIHDRFTIMLQELKDRFADRSKEFGVVGSIGHYFESELRKAGNELGMQLTKVLAEPLPALVEYHSSTS